jgi:6-phosphogluconolactonase
METTAKYKPNIEIASDAEDLASRTVSLFVSAAHEALESKGTFYVALSGGHTPKLAFEKLAASPAAQALLWRHIHVFWVDERYVPADSPQSNYRLAADAFLNRVPIPPDNVHRIPTEHEDIATAARSYEMILRDVFGLAGGQMPQFDLIVLGMGADGHTGSLLPNCFAPFDTEDLACVVYVMDNRLNRITLTHPVLRAARQLVVLVSGAEKAHTLRDVLTGEPDEVRYPIHVLWPVLDKVVWFVDRDAAAAVQ